MLLILTARSPRGISTTLATSRQRYYPAVSFWESGLAKQKGRLAPPLLTTDDWQLRTAYVPSFHPAKYSSCSGVSLSILIPIDSSFNLATRLSNSSGTR